MAEKNQPRKSSNEAEARELEVVKTNSPSPSNEKVPSSPDIYEENGVHHKVSLITTTRNTAYLHGQMNMKLFLSLTAMSFLWVGSQIPLYLFGSVLPRIYQDIGGVDRYVWFVIGYLIPNAALCPFVGALSDLFGRRMVAVVGQVCLIVGPIITATANTRNIAIGML
jgi:hypothetical protein